MDYERWKIRTYRYWDLYLKADDQRYLGRAYVWLKREGKMQRFSQLNGFEAEELFKILRQYEHVLDTLFEPDHYNNAWFGNQIGLHDGHGHMHIIPRYCTSRTFSGVKFLDMNWGKNYTPHERFVPHDRVLLSLRDSLEEILAGLYEEEM